MSYVRAFRAVAIPQSGLLAQVRSFWLRVGRSCTARASLPGTELPPHLLCLLFRLLHFFLPVFEDNGLLFWLPDVLCQPTEVVLWSLLGIEMFF